MGELENGKRKKQYPAGFFWSVFVYWWIVGIIGSGFYVVVFTKGGGHFGVDQIALDSIACCDVRL